MRLVPVIQSLLSRKGSLFFSLIELLVVVSIFAILSSLVVPSLKRVYYHTEMLSCVQNLKDIGVVWVIYAEDYDGFYPDYGDSVSFAEADANNDGTINVNDPPLYLERDAVYGAKRRGLFALSHSGTTNYDLRPHLANYFSRGFNEVLNCPLAEQGGVYADRRVLPWNNKITTDIDCYDDNKNAYKYGGWSRYALFPAGNDVRSGFYIKKGMRQLGDKWTPILRYKVGFSWQYLADKEFSWLAGDTTWVTNGTTFHGNHRGPLELGTVNTGFYYWEGGRPVLPWTLVPGQSLNANFLADDGSVKNFEILASNWYDNGFYITHDNPGGHHSTIFPDAD